MITVEDAVSLLEQAVAERGETYVYPDTNNCRYVYEDGSPSCLVGLALAKRDPSILSTIVDLGLNGESADSIGAAVDMTPGAEQVFMYAQNSQDTGKPWGEALATARSRASQVGDDGLCHCGSCEDGDEVCDLL